MENISQEEKNRSSVDRPMKNLRWDQFLRTRSLRVLLVEHDDSTRHIVTALLRKCSYHVSAVADGLKAWEVMIAKNYSFDLVLTEFEIPSLSGIGLLGMIVGTEESRNIPVIMMSSQDSVGIVHKCMLKGAADFLVKPLRKNELRNLWQHVWRRQCSSSAYASTSENNAASNQISSNSVTWSQTDETTDKGSDFDLMLDQSLGSKLAKKADISQMDLLVEKSGQNDVDIMKTAVIDENASTSATRSSPMKHVLNPSTLPLWELSVMARLNGCGQQHVRQKNVLNHSNASAFSRYGGKSNSSFICTKNIGYVDQPLEDVEQFQMFSGGNMEKDGCLSSFAQAHNVPHSQFGFMPKSIPVEAVPYTLIVQNLGIDDNLASHSGSIEFQCLDLNHPVPCMGQVNDAETGEERDLSFNHSEDVIKGCGSNGSDNTTTGIGMESGIENCIKNGTNSDLSHREAALIKFRLKRKDRCFAKKVRYHSRQKLAEQRPRVKGQFVSQKILELNSTLEADC